MNRFSHSPLKMAKMPIESKEALALLNGLDPSKRHDATNAKRIAIFALVVLGLSIVIPLCPDIKRYLTIRSM
jgi:hypothetical protein